MEHEDNRVALPVEHDTSTGVVPLRSSVENRSYFAGPSKKQLLYGTRGSDETLADRYLRFSSRLGNPTADEDAAHDPVHFFFFFCTENGIFFCFRCVR